MRTIISVGSYLVDECFRWTHWAAKILFLYFVVDVKPKLTLNLLVRTYLLDNTVAPHRNRFVFSYKAVKTGQLFDEPHSLFAWTVWIRGHINMQTPIKQNNWKFGFFIVMLQHYPSLLSNERMHEFHHVENCSNLIWIFISVRKNPKGKGDASPFVLTSEISDAVVTNKLSNKTFYSKQFKTEILVVKL